MADTRLLRGFGTKETLLAIIVIVIAGAILILIGRRIAGKDLLLNEAGRMRKVYIALSLYEEQHDNQPSPNLVAASAYDQNRFDFISKQDPFAEAGTATSFPADPGLDNHETSPFRISFSYLQDFVRAKKLAVKPWAEARLDPLLGVMGNEWLGSVHAGENFQASVSGRVLRINTDGAVFLLANRGGPKPLGDAHDLFVRR